MDSTTQYLKNDSMIVKKEDVLAELTKTEFRFDSRHHYTDEMKKEIWGDNFYADVTLKVWFSSDLETIIDYKILEFDVFDKFGEIVELNTTEKEELECINL